MSEGNASKADVGARRYERWIEIGSAVLLALATVATAWSSYQSARWSGVQANSFSSANASRVESTRASTEAGQLVQVDIALFTDWLNAFAEEQTELAGFYSERFRDEFQPAFEAWLATDPRTNPDAPKTPFAMPEYTVEAAQRAERLEAEADQFSSEAREANQRSDNYVLCVVLFASVLFFAGISTKFESPQVRFAMLGLATAVFIGAAAWVATFPVTVSI